MLNKELLQQALDALESTATIVDSYYIERGKQYTPECDAAITALRSALAAPMPEPVAYRSSRNNGKTWIITEGDPTDLMPDVGGIVVPLYAAPPAAPAPVVPLTDEQFADMVAEASLAVVRAAQVEGLTQGAAGWRERANQLEAEVAGLREAATQVLEIVDMQREPHWAYRNTVTTRRQEIRDILSAAPAARKGAT